MSLRVEQIIPNIWRLAFCPPYFHQIFLFTWKRQLAKKTDKRVISHISPLMNLGIDQKKKKKVKRNDMHKRFLRSCSRSITSLIHAYTLKLKPLCNVPILSTLVLLCKFLFRLIFKTEGGRGVRGGGTKLIRFQWRSGKRFQDKKWSSKWQIHKTQQKWGQRYQTN